jgi:hypothetical protein
MEYWQVRSQSFEYVLFIYLLGFVIVIVTECSIMTQKRPILEHFYWHRIVVDEGHEVIVNKVLSSSKKEGFSPGTLLIG